MEDNHNETVVEALGLNLKWADDNIDTLKSFISANGTISELITSLGSSVKEDHFGELRDDASNLSEYEIKLLYSGYQVARFMERENRKALLAAVNPFSSSGNPLLDILKGMSGNMQIRMDEDGSTDEAPGPIKDIIRDIIKGIKNRQAKDDINDGDGDND